MNVEAYTVQKVMGGMSTMTLRVRMPTKIVLISGSRDIKNKALVQSYVRDIISSTEEFRNSGGRVLVIHGGATGVDYEVARTAVGYPSVTVQQYLPNYQIYGKSAPVVRNKEMVGLADEVYCIWDGVSPGTKSVITYARKAKKLARVYQLEKPG